MAAPVLESTQTTTWATSGQTIVITKPVNLAVGDLMICRIVTETATDISNFSVFTEKSRESTSSGAYNSIIGYKIADSSDVAASNFTITVNTIGDNKMGSISRISNPDTLATNYVYAEGSASNTISPSFTGLTPTNHSDSNLLLMFWLGDNGASGGAPTIASYAIATSNPSWTEVYELSTTTSTDVTASMASATRPETTATGNFTATWSDGTTDSCGQLLAITSPWSFSLAESTTVTESLLNNTTFSYADTTTLTEDVDSAKPRTWTNTTKSSSTWLNQEK